MFTCEDPPTLKYLPFITAEEGLEFQPLRHLFGLQYSL